MSIADLVQKVTLKVIVEEGVKAVTIRRVALELNRSTTVITHYFDSRESLLRESISSALRERRDNAQTLIVESTDPLWDFLEWSIQDDHIEIWRALIAASRAISEPEVIRLVEDFEEWWTVTLEDLLRGKVKKGYTIVEVSDVIGIVVEGLLFTDSKPTSSGLTQSQVLRITIGPLLK